MLAMNKFVDVQRTIRSRLWLLSVPLVFASVWPPSRTAGADQKAEATKVVPKEVHALAGTYTGSWTMYGIDEQAKVVKRAAWTDTMKAVDPQVKGDRAFVNTSDEMVFEGGQVPPFKVQGMEGYLLKSDGAVGDYFIEISGQTNRLVKVGENVWCYTTPSTAQELARLGFPKDASGQHVLVKVVAKEQGRETHRISRLTTVNWKDKEGMERSLQFVSLQGHHQRRPSASQ
jgi:hypothetical protein